MKKTPIISLAIALLLIPSVIPAVAGSFNYISLGTDENMPSAPTSIFAQEKGFLWVGTADGVVRYDNDGHKLYKHDDADASSIPADAVTSVLTDSEGTTWILTEGGLARYVRATDSFERISGVRAVSAISMTSSCYFGAADTLYRYDFAEKQMHVVKSFASDITFVIEGMYAWTEGRILLVNASRGACVYDPRSSTLSSPQMDMSGSEQIWVDSHYRVWRSTKGEGLVCYSSEFVPLLRFSEEAGTLSSNSVTSFCECDGMIWVGTSSGINIINPDNGSSTILRHVPGDRKSFPAGAVTTVFCGDRQNVFAGRASGGIVVISQVSINEDLIAGAGPEFLCPDGIASIYQGESDRHIWLGTDGDGIVSMDTASGEYRAFQSTKAMSVTNMVGFGQSRILFYSPVQGFRLFDKSGGSVHPFTFGVEELDNASGRDVALFEGAAGTIFVSVGHSLYSFSAADPTPVRVRIPEPAVQYGLVRGVDGRQKGKYFFNDRYIFTFDLATKGLHDLQDLGEGAVVTSASEDNSDRIWLIVNGGLSCYNIWTNAYEKVSDDGVSGFSSVICDKLDRVWLGGGKGLCIYSLGSKSFFTLDKTDGISSGSFLPGLRLITNEGNIVFAGLESVVCIDNQFALRTLDDPELSLLDFYVEGERINNPNSVKIPYTSSSIEFKVFAGESRMLRDKIFRFRLENGDDARELISRKSDVTIHGLGPGHYKLYASCLSKNSKWTEWTEIADFSIAQCWYLRWWFILICFGVVLLLVVYILVNAGRNKDSQVKIERIKQKYQSDEERLTFLVNVSHELRTPLTLIMGPLERVLASMPKDNSNYPQLKGVQRQAMKMKTLLNTVLTAHQVQEGVAPKDIEPQDFNIWTKNVADDFREEAASRKIGIKLDLDPALGPVSFDSSKCEVVLSNIIMNAITHTPDNSDVTVKTTLRPERDVIRVSVADCGPGIDEDTIEKLFQRFYQDSENRIAGYGIGLSYSKSIIDQMHGRISAFNNETGGATFFFEIPANAAKPVQGAMPRSQSAVKPVVQPAAPVAVPEAPKPAPVRTVTSASSEIEPFADAAEDQSQTITELNQATLLVVEDDFELRQYLKSELTGPIQNVLLAENGVEAVKILGSEHVDVIVSDVMMPEMDGFALCRYVKTTVAISHIPVILLTARSDENSRMLGYKNGADDYITKPFDLNILEDSINNLFRNREEMRRRYASEGPLPSSSETTFSSADEKFLKKFDELVAENISDPDLDTKMLVNGMGMSRTVLFNKVKQLTGLNLQSYVNKVRMEYVIKLMKTTDLPLADIAEKSGFSSPRYFSTSFKNYTGVTPSQYKKDIS